MNANIEILFICIILLYEFNIGTYLVLDKKKKNSMGDEMIFKYNLDECEKIGYMLFRLSDDCV